MSAIGKPFLSGRVPKELWDAVNDRAKKTGKTRTDIMIEAVSAYLELGDKFVSKNPLEDRVKNLELELSEIKQGMQQFMEKIDQPQTLSAMPQTSKKEPPPLSEFFSKAYEKHYQQKK